MHLNGLLRVCYLCDEFCNRNEKLGEGNKYYEILKEKLENNVNITGYLSDEFCNRNEKLEEGNKYYEIPKGKLENNVNITGSLYDILKIVCKHNLYSFLDYLFNTYPKINTLVTLDNNYCVRIAMLNDNYEVVGKLIKTKLVNPYDNNYNTMITLFNNGQYPMFDHVSTLYKNFDLTKYNYYKTNFIEDETLYRVVKIYFNNYTWLYSEPCSEELQKLVTIYEMWGLTTDCANKLWKDSKWRKFISKRSPEMINYLLSFPEINGLMDNNWATRWSIKNTQFSALDLLVKKYGVNRIVYNSQLREIIDGKNITDHFDMVDYLLSFEKVDCRHYPKMILSWAIMYNRVNTVKLLLTKPLINPSTNNNKPLKNAIKYNNIEIIKLLLSDYRVFSKYSFIIQASKDYNELNYLSFLPLEIIGEIIHYIFII